MSNIKQKAVNTAVDALEAFRGKQFTGALEVIEALDAAGLLRTGREQEVMCRLTTTAMGSDLMGQRLGLRSEFVTPAMERAVEALVGTVHGWEVTHDVSLNASLRIKFSSTYDAQAFAGCLSAILAERASREKPEPRYEAKGHVVFDGDKAVSTAYCFDTKEQARAVAKSLNDLEARP